MMKRIELAISRCPSGCAEPSSGEGVVEVEEEEEEDDEEWSEKAW